MKKLILGLIIISVGVYAYKIKENQDMINQVIQEGLDKKQIIKLQDGYHFYAVEDSAEMEVRLNIITRYCKGNETCEVEQIFKYVTDKPYKISEHDRNTIEVIEGNGGDCDEKSYVMASMLKKKNHNCVIVFSEGHAFVAVHLKNRSNIYPNTASLNINEKYYFYAETTAKGAHIGWFNDIKPEAFQAIYDVTNEKEIALNEVSLNLN